MKGDETKLKASPSCGGSWPKEHVFHLESLKLLALSWETIQAPPPPPRPVSESPVAGAGVGGGTFDLDLGAMGPFVV